MMGSITGRPRSRATLAAALAFATVGATSAAWAQAPPPAAETRAASIAAAEAAKALTVKPYEAGRGEVLIKKLEEAFLTGNLHWHPFFNNAYSGGGFTLGAGYATHVSSYNKIDVRGSYTPKGYIRAEAEFMAPRLFDRRGTCRSWAAGAAPPRWGSTASAPATPPATTGSTTASSSRTRWPTSSSGRRGGSCCWAPGSTTRTGRWDPGRAPSHRSRRSTRPTRWSGWAPSRSITTPPGRRRFDWRTSPGYTRRGGYYGVTFHDYSEPDDLYGFRQTDYEAIQHVPLGRDFWVLSLHGRATTTDLKDDQQIPYFMQPPLGGGSSLRGFSSWRFRDRHSLLLQAELRVLVSPFIDMALFYDAGKVTNSRSDLDFEGLKTDFGVGFRLHSPFVTPLRIELAKSNEGLSVIFSSSAAF